MPLDLTDDKSTLVQVMVWCRQATSHYLSQCWPRSMAPNGVTRPQWVNRTMPIAQRISSDLAMAMPHSCAKWKMQLYTLSRRRKGPLPCFERRVRCFVNSFVVYHQTSANPCRFCYQCDYIHKIWLLFLKSRIHKRLDFHAALKVKRFCLDRALKKESPVFR